MTQIDDDVHNRLFDWDSQFDPENHASNEWAISVLKAGLYDLDWPVIFDIPRSGPAVEFAIAAGVDFTQRDKYGYTVLFKDDLYDSPTYVKVADVFAEAGGIDWSDEEGLTALSVQVKWGMVENVRALLERGADPNSFGTIARYGGAKLSVAKQAVNCVGVEGIDEETRIIELLTLLKKFGLKINAQQKDELFKRTQSNNKAYAFIEANL